MVREDQAWDGCYFIFAGEVWFFPLPNDSFRSPIGRRYHQVKIFDSCSQAQVSGPAEEENRSEFLLKQYDYFGHGGKDNDSLACFAERFVGWSYMFLGSLFVAAGISGHVHSTDIVAMSEVLFST